MNKSGQATEAQEQQALIQWAQNPLTRRKYPDIDLLYHAKNETREGAKTVVFDKTMGVKKGVPDLFLPVPCCGYHGLFVEMKRQTGGRLSPEQIWWGDHLKAQGYAWYRCNGWQEAAECISRYLDGAE